MPQVKIFWLVLTEKCNNRCVWCYAEGSPHKNAISFSKAKKIIDLMADCGAKRCILIGGEPTCYPDLTALISHAKSKNLTAFIITNGRLLSESYIDKLKKAGLDGMSISIEGSTAKIHDGVTQVKGSFDQTVQGIKNCIKMKMPFSTITTISSKNSDDLTAIMDLSKSLGVRRTVYNICGPTIIDNESPYVLRPKEMAKNIELVHIHAKKIGMRIRFATPVAKCLFNEKVLDNMIKNRSFASGKACQVFDGSGCAFNYDGGIMPCTHWITLYLGNVFEDGLLKQKEFQDFWDNGKPKELRDKMARFPAKKCSSCDVWGKCIGGCPLFWLKFDARKEIGEA